MENLCSRPFRLLSASLLLCTLPILTAGYANTEAKKLWQVSSSCDAHDLDAMILETKDLITAAVADLNLVTSSQYLTPLTTTARFDALGRANKMFGVRTEWFETRINAEDLLRLGVVRDNYLRVSAYLNHDATFPIEDNAMYCDQSALQGTDVFDQIIPGMPELKGIKLVDGVKKDSRLAGFTGPVWYSDEFRAKSQVPTFMIARDPSIPLCGPHTGAFTVSRNAAGPTRNRMMIFCARTWDQTNYKTSLASYQKRVARDSYMSDYRGIAGVFLHEMMHWLALTPHIDDIKYTQPGDAAPQDCYGLLRSFRLAQADRLKAQINADNYRIFAELCYMPKIDFIDENRPDNVPAPPPALQSQSRIDVSATHTTDVSDAPALPASRTTVTPLGISGLPQLNIEILPAPRRDDFEPPNDAAGKKELAQNKASFTSALDKVRQTSSSSSSSSKSAATGFVTRCGSPLGAGHDL